MSCIKIHKPDEKELKEKGVLNWPVWEKEESEFPWHYDSNEQCYIIKGRAEVKPAKGDSVQFGEGDFVVFPAGMDCIWKITDKIRKHYKMD